MGDMRKVCKFLSISLKKRDHKEGLDVNRRIILERISENRL
jgi:hypothetical protein